MTRTGSHSALFFALHLVLGLAWTTLALPPAALLAAPLHNACLSSGSGEWGDPATWAGCAGGVPGAGDSVYIQSGHTVALAADAAAGELHLSTGVDDISTDDDGRLALREFVLDLHGKLRGYTAPVGTVPGAAPATLAADAITGTPRSGGRLRVVGATRVLAAAGEWWTDKNASGTDVAVVEIAAGPGAVITVTTAMRASAWIIASGTLQTSQTLLVDQHGGAPGNVTIGAEGVLITSASSNVTPLMAAPGSRTAGTLTVDGRLVIAGASPRLNMSAVALNNVVEYAGATNQMLLKAFSGSISQYNHLILGGSGIKSLVEATTVSGSLTRSGSATLNSTSTSLLTYGAGAALVYAGSAQQTTGGELTAAKGSIGGLRVENPAGLKLGANLLVTGELLLQGSLETGAYTLRLGPEAACAGAGDVIGRVTRGAVALGEALCLGNPNLAVTFSPGATLPTSLSVGLARGIEPFGGAVLRRYTVEAPGFEGTATLRLPYDSADRNDNDPAQVHLWRYDGSRWMLQAATARGTGADGKFYVERSGVTAFSDWALADGWAPTAVTVTGLAGEMVDGRVRLRWHTASEVDCLGFRIYRSPAPGVRGVLAAEVPAQAPGSLAGGSYVWVDPQAPDPRGAGGGAIYYWLEVIDAGAGARPLPAPAVVRLPAVYLPVLRR